MSDQESKEYTGKLADPQWRHERAKKARAAQTSTDTYIARLVDRAPELTAEQRSRLALVLNLNQAVTAERKAA